MSDHTGYLGRIILFQVVNARVRYDDLARWFEELQLDRGYLIPPLRPIDAFRKATGGGTDVTVDAPWRGENATVTLHWEDESVDKDRITRRLMRTIKVRGKKNSTPDAVAHAIFYKRRPGVEGGEKVRMTLERDVLPPEAVSRVEQALKDAHARFEAGKTWVDTQALRGIARDYLVDRLRGLRVRDGVYFVFRDLQDELDRLATLVRRFGPECLFHPVELVDGPQHRDLISDALTEMLAGRAVALQREINALRSKYRTRIPAQKFAPLATKYEQIMDLATDYAEAVGVAHDDGALENLTDTVVATRRVLKYEEEER